jgi:murein DD-endopeptidase MepM/ murein hydrolase activator NlpD
VSRGKHRKIEPRSHTGAAVATTGALALGGLFAATGSASAAPESAWDSIAQCESGGVWDLPYGDADSTGGLQFQVASWNDSLAQLRADGVDTSAFPAMPYQATKYQQILAGEALLKLQGPGAWTCNDIQGGPLNGYSGGDYAPYLGDGSLPPASPVDPVPGDSHPSADKPKTHGHKAKHRHHKGCGHKHDAPAPAEPTGDTVTVAPGDTLYGLTLAGTGNGALDNWEPLYEANKDVIGSNPDLIYPGQVLTLPWAAPSEQPPAEDPAPADPAPVDPAPPAPSTAEYRSPLVDMSNLGDGYIANGDCVSRSCGGHSGADFTAPEGTAVRAVHAGTVLIGGAGEAYGNHVILNHGDGTYTLYAHLSSITVSAGATVAAGDTIGAVGSTGNSSGPHLHFEVRTDPTAFSAGVFLDPVAWLTAHGIIIN